MYSNCAEFFLNSWKIYSLIKLEGAPGARYLYILWGAQLGWIKFFLGWYETSACLVSNIIFISTLLPALPSVSGASLRLSRALNLGPEPPPFPRV